MSGAFTPIIVFVKTSTASVPAIVVRSVIVTRQTCQIDLSTLRGGPEMRVMARCSRSTGSDGTFGWRIDYVLASDAR